MHKTEVTIFNIPTQSRLWLITPVSRAMWGRLHFISIGFCVGVYLVLVFCLEFPVMGNLKRFKIIKMVVIWTSAVITVYYMTIL